MRILLVTNYQPPHPGGIEYAAASLARAWRRRGHTVTWLTTDIPRGGAASTPENIRVRASNFWERLLQINSPLVWPTEWPRIRQRVRFHDVINIHSLAPGLSSLTRRTALREARPMVVTQHVGIIPLKPAWLDYLQRVVYVRAAREVMASGARLTFVGEAVRQWFIENAALPPDRLVMTPAGIDAEDFHFVSEEERRAARQKWGLSDNRLNILFVGRFFTKKGLPFIRELAAAMPNAHFTLVGSGPEDAGTWGLLHVQVVRFVSTPELRELYGAHDVFIMPSFGEGWPAVVPQAMACGLPCMISEECFAGFGRDRERFVVLRRDLSLWLDILRNRAQVLPLSETERKRISEYALATWDWQRTADLYLDLFENALRQKRVSA